MSRNRGANDLTDKWLLFIWHWEHIGGRELWLRLPIPSSLYPVSNWARCHWVALNEALELCVFVWCHRCSRVGNQNISWTSAIKPMGNEVQSVDTLIRCNRKTTHFIFCFISFSFPSFFLFFFYFFLFLWIFSKREVVGAGGECGEEEEEEEEEGKREEKEEKGGRNPGSNVNGLPCSGNDPFVFKHSVLNGADGCDDTSSSIFFYPHLKAIILVLTSPASVTSQPLSQRMLVGRVGDTGTKFDHRLRFRLNCYWIKWFITSSSISNRQMTLS